MKPINFEEFDSLVQAIEYEANNLYNAVEKRIYMIQDNIIPVVEKAVDKWETEYPDGLGFDSPIYEELDSDLQSLINEVDLLDEIKSNLKHIKDYTDGLRFDYPYDDYSKRIFKKAEHNPIDIDANNTYIERYEKNPNSNNNLGITLPEDEIKDNPELQGKFIIVYDDPHKNPPTTKFGTYTTREKAEKELNNWYIKNKNPQIIELL